LEWARLAGIRSDAFALDGGHPSETFVMATLGVAWAVYYSERGLEQDRQWFSNEGEALSDLQRRLIKTLSQSRDG